MAPPSAVVHEAPAASLGFVSRPTVRTAPSSVEPPPTAMGGAAAASVHSCGGSRASPSSTAVAVAPRASNSTPAEYERRAPPSTIACDVATPSFSPPSAADVEPADAVGVGARVHVEQLQLQLAPYVVVAAAVVSARDAVRRPPSCPPAAASPRARRRATTERELRWRAGRHPRPAARRCGTVPARAPPRRTKDGVRIGEVPTEGDAPSSITRRAGRRRALPKSITRDGLAPGPQPPTWPRRRAGALDVSPPTLPGGISRRKSAATFSAAADAAVSSRQTTRAMRAPRPSRSAGGALNAGRGAAGTSAGGFASPTSRQPSHLYIAGRAPPRARARAPREALRIHAPPPPACARARRELLVGS